MEKAPIAIALDMDETLCSLVSACMDVCRRLWPEKQFKLPIYGRYSQWFNDSLTQDEREELYATVKTEAFYMSLPPVLNPTFSNSSIENLSRVCWDRYREGPKIVTARIGFCPNPEETTREYLRLHKFADIDNVEIHAIDGQTCKTTKFRGPTMIVDDSISVADAISASRHHHMIMVNHPWNDGYVKKGNVRIVPSRRMTEAVSNFADEYIAEAVNTRSQPYSHFS